MSHQVPECLHDVSKYMALAQSFANRDAVIYYWTCYHVVQEGMKIDRTSKESLGFLTSLLSELENIKKENPETEAIKNDIVAQAHIENLSLRVFRYADENDRNGNFDPKIRRAFYNASLMLDVLAGFKELDESLANIRKYAKWKAAYLFNCEKTGEKPVPGGFNEDKKDDSQSNQQPQQHTTGPTTGLDPPAPAPNLSDFGFNNDITQIGGQPSMPTSYSSDPTLYQQNTKYSGYPSQQNYQTQIPQPTPPARPSVQPASYRNMQPTTVDPQPSSGLKLEHFLEARKYCKYALSSIDYEDAAAAIDNLMKTIKVLQGQSP